MTKTFYAFLLVLLVVFSYCFIDANLPVFNALYSGFAIEKKVLTTIVFLLFVLLLFTFYMRLLFLVQRKKIRKREVLNAIAVTIAILIFSYPAMLSYDIFNYVTTAKVSFFYHENPYIVMPIELVGEPNLSFTRAANKIALYGPAWIIFTAIPHVLSFGNIILAIFSFKVSIALFYIATVWLIGKLSQNLFSVVLFAFNPLVLLETLVSSHNDIVMMFFALLSFYLLDKRKVLVACILLMISILIKYATIALIPIFLFALFQTYKRKDIVWDTLFSLSAWAMFTVFLLAPIREEIYSWYVIWILAFAVLVPKKTFLITITLALTFGTLFRYVPVLFTGSYSGTTPLIKEVVTFTPLILVSLLFVWKKSFFQKLFR